MGKFKSILVAAALLVGVWLIGFDIGRRQFRDEVLIGQSDTIVVYKTKHYSKLDLTAKTYKLNIPDIPKLVYIPADSSTIVYRDSLRYITLPRQSYFTSTDEVDIWHSGVCSTIDSLSVKHKTMAISKTGIATQNLSPWRYGVTVGLDYGMMWGKYITPNVGAEIEYKKLTLGVECGVNMNLVNSTIEAPMPYLQASIKYRLAGR